MMDFRPIGWERLEADWWPAIAASLPRPWPREAVYMDLRWWRGQEATTGKKLLPARRPLQERWGWKEWDTRTILREEAAWVDPRQLSQTPPKILQNSSQDPPNGATENAENLKESSQNPPKTLPESSQNPPSRDLLTQNTIHNSQSTLSPPPLPHPEQPVRKPEPGEREPETISEKEQDNPETLSLYQLFGPKLGRALTEAGVSDVADLTRRTARQTRMLKGIGEGNLGTLQLRLQAMGLAFAEDGRVAATEARPVDVSIKRREFTVDPPFSGASDGHKNRVTSAS